MKGMSGLGRWRMFGSGEARLILSGVGKLRAALATQRLAAEAAADSAVVNVGCCGAVDEATHAIGDAQLIHAIRDHGSGRTHYPDVLAGHRFAESAIETWDRAVRQTDVPGAPLVDMEAFGFYEAASLHWPPHRIAVLKVVSDLLAPERCQQEMVEALIASRVAEFATHARALLALPLSSCPPLGADLEQRLAATGTQMKLSSTQRQQLREATIACGVRNPERLAALQPPAEAPRHKQERASMLQALIATLNPKETDE